MLRIMTYKVSFLFLFLIVLAGTASAGETKILIAVAGESADPVAPISQVAARTPYLLFFDAENNLLKAIKNPNASATGGAGPKTAHFLDQQEVTLVIAGQFGHKMLQALHSSKIETVRQQGRIIDAVKEQNHEK